MAQYADNLTAGTKALLERYPTFHADVYPTHRSVAFPTFVTDNTQVCATTAKLTRNGESMERSEEHTSELQPLMRISYAVFCLKTKNTPIAFLHVINTNLLKDHTQTTDNAY